VKFDPKITSTIYKKTGDGSDIKDIDGEILKSILTIKDDNTNKPPIEIFKSENPLNYRKNKLVHLKR
jgi:hypothetical protein